MPSTPSPLFSINGAAVGAKVAVEESGEIVATLDDITGVAPVTWEVSRGDDVGQGSVSTLIQSGSVGQTVTFDVGAKGESGILRCTVAGGIDPSTGRPSEAMSAEVKFYVPTSHGLETIVAGEQDEDYVSDATYGPAVPLNAAIRGAHGQLVDYGTGSLAGGAGKTTIAAIAMASNNEVAIYNLRMVAFDAVTPHGAWYDITQGFKRISGTATAIGSSAADIGEDDTAWAATLEASGSNVLATFTPDSANLTYYDYAVYKIASLVF